MAVQTKTWYTSKTIWLNIVGVVVLGLQVALNQHLVPLEWQELVLAVLNILVRFRTSTRVTLR